MRNSPRLRQVHPAATLVLAFLFACTSAPTGLTLPAPSPALPTDQHQSLLPLVARSAIAPIDEGLPLHPLTPPHSLLSPSNLAGLRQVAQVGRGWPAAVAVSPKGGLYALATSLGVYVYPIDSSEPERFWSFDSPVYSVAFDRDGTHLAAGDWRGTISIIDLGSGAVERRPGAHPRAIRSLAFSPDGQVLASGSEDGTVRVWTLPALSERYRFGGVAYGYWGYGVRSLAFSPEGSVLASGGDTGYVSRWTMIDGKELAHLGTGSGLVFGVAISHDGHLVASANSNGQVELWDMYTGMLLRTLAPHPFGAWSLAFTPDDSQIITGAADGSLRIWNVRQGTLVLDKLAHTHAIDGLAIDPSGTLLSVASGWQLARWKLPELVSESSPPEHFPAFRSLAINPSGLTLALGGDDSRIRLWDLASGALVWLNPGLDERQSVLSLRFAPTEPFLAAAHSGADELVVWDLSLRSQIARQKLLRIRSLAFAPDGSQIAAAGSGLLLWDFASRSATQRQSSGLLTAIDWSLDSSRGGGDSLVAVAMDDGTTQVWDSRTFAPRQFEAPDVGPLWSIDLTSDGSRLAAGANDGSVRLWDVHTGRLIALLSGHTAPVQTVAFSSDGALLATGAMDNTLRVWDGRSGRALRTLTEPRGWLFSAAFSPDGRMLAGASWDGTVRIWGIPR